MNDQAKTDENVITAARTLLARVSDNDASVNVSTEQAKDEQLEIGKLKYERSIAAHGLTDDETI